MAKLDDHIGELLDPYRTGELGETDRLRVEGHLETCADCRSELEALAAFARTVERGYAAEQAARETEREPDWARLRAAVVSRTSARTFAARRARLPRYVPQAALAVLALVALGVLWEQGIRSPGEADRALESERTVGGRADGARERSGGPAATSDAVREARPAEEDRFAEAGAPAADRPAATLPAEEPKDESNDRRGAALEGRTRRHEVGLDADRSEQEGARYRKERAEDAAEVAENEAVTAARRDARPEGQVVDEVDRAAAEPAPEGLGEVAAENAMKQAAAPADVERFRRDARSALSAGDTLLASRALAQWRDSLAPRGDLPPELERAARALADSLAAFLATRP